MTTLAMLFAALAAFPSSGPADALASTERPAIEEAVGHYFVAGDTNSSAELRRAFHPTTMMFFVKDGSLTGVSQPEWWKRIDDNKTVHPAQSRQFAIVDVAGDAAVAKIVSGFPEYRIEDYMSMLKLDGRWWIVGKIFHRTPPGPAAGASAVAADRDAIRSVLQTNFAALDAADGALLASVYSPRAMTYTVLEGRLVAVPVAEWSARFDAQKASGAAATAPKVTHRIVTVDSEGDAAFARVEHASPGGIWVDYASLLKVGGSWKIVGVVYGRQGGAS